MPPAAKPQAETPAVYIDWGRVLAIVPDANPGWSEVFLEGGQHFLIETAALPPRPRADRETPRVQSAAAEQFFRRSKKGRP